MEDFLKAIIEFFTDFFAALSEFIGGDFAFGDILGTVGGLLGDEETTAADAE